MQLLTHPFTIVLIGIAIVIGLIMRWRVNAFIALIVAAVVVSFLSPGDLATKVVRVTDAFGAACANIGVLIAAAAIVGQCMMESGAADRIVQTFIRVLGEKRGGGAMTASSFVLGIPVFFDTVFYLMAPLARSMHRRTGRQYLKYLVAIAAGGAATHTMVPPTPGPLIAAAAFGVDLGTMIVMGLAIAVPAAFGGLVYAGFIDRWMPVPMRPLPGVVEETHQEDHRPLPGLFVSVLPIVLPVALISFNTLVQALYPDTQAGNPAVYADSIATLKALSKLVGNSTFALLLSAAVAALVQYFHRRPERGQMARSVEGALMSAGMIILITAAGGAFGAMLKTAGIGGAIEQLARTDNGVPAYLLMVLGFCIASVMKVAQGSTTVAMVTTSGIIAAMAPPATALPFHPVYLALAIASGAQIASWMNDSGFWIFAKMGGLTEREALRSWTPCLIVISLVGGAVTLALALLLPMPIR